MRAGKETTMRIAGLVQAPFNTTMMGVMRGALNHYGANVSDPFLFGASGHAFVINIHRELCPSGPYVWDREPVNALLANLGLRIVYAGFCHTGSDAAERAAIEARLRDALDRGMPCFLVNMEFQLITGYDDTGFLTAQPWPQMDFPPAHLTFGTCSEMADEVHATFYVIEPCEPVSRERAVLDSLRYAVSLWRQTPDDTDDYAMGAAGYERWIEAVGNGRGSEHGAWWNATVWSECRSHAAAYFREIEEMFPSAADVRAIGMGYREIADLLHRCADREMPSSEKAELLAWARDLEDACIGRIDKLIAAT